jgi:hypothetical protein
MKNLLKKLNISVNKYYRMNDTELAAEGQRWKIFGFGNSDGPIERQIIIDALLKKDNANNSRYAIVVSIFAIAMSVIALIVR